MGMDVVPKTHPAAFEQLQMCFDPVSEPERKPTPGVYIVERAACNPTATISEPAWNCKAIGFNRLLAELPSYTPETRNEKTSTISFDASDGMRYLTDDNLADNLEEGFIVTVRNDGSCEIDWALMLAQVGITASDVTSVSGKNDSDEFTEGIHKAIARVLYLLFSGNALHQSDLAALSRSHIESILALCQEKGLFLKSAGPVVSAMLAEYIGEDERNRLKYMLSLSRTTLGKSEVWPFNKAAFLKTLAWLPSVYKDSVEAIANKVEALCRLGSRPAIMLKAPGGAPVEEISLALGQALSRGTGYSYIDGPSISSPLDLIGANSKFSGASVGRIARLLFTQNARTIVIGGVDHLVDLKKTDGDPIGFLAQCITDGVYPIDSFIEVPMNLDDVAFVFMEASSAVTELDRSCSAVFSFKKLSRHEKIESAVEMLKGHGLTCPEQDVAMLVDNYAYDDGITLLGKAVDSLVEAVNPGQSTIDAAFIQSVLPKPNEEDPRFWVASKRARLEQVGDQCALLADRLLAETIAKTDNTIAKDVARKRLKMLLGSIPSGRRISPPDRRALITQLQATHPGISDHDMNALVGAIMASVRNVRHPRPILLVGPAGTGKTTTIASIAHALGDLQVVKKDMSAMSSTELFGAANSMPSVITENISLLDGDPGILHLDEVDKMAPKLCTSQSLCSLLDEGMINDCYLNLTCDYSKWLVILTANNLDEVSPYVLNRSQIVHLDGYTPSSKVEIARKALIDRKSADLGVEPPLIDETALFYLTSLDDEAGLRLFENRLELVVSEIEKPRVTLSDVEALFPREESSIRGISALMARGGAKGGAALNSVATAKIGKTPYASALTNGVAFNFSLHTAVSALTVGMGLDTSGVKVALEEVDDQIHAIVTHATLAVAVAIWFAANGLNAVCPGVSFVGNLGLTGEVKPLEHEYIPKGIFMVARAAAHGIETIVCPGNFADTPDISSYADRMGINLVAVDHVSEAVDYAKGRHSIADLITELETIDFEV